MLRFYSIHFCRQEVRRRRAKTKEKKDPLSITGDQLPFINGLRCFHHRAAFPLPLLIYCFLYFSLFCNVNNLYVNSGDWLGSDDTALSLFLCMGCSPLFTLHMNNEECRPPAFPSSFNPSSMRCSLLFLLLCLDCSPLLCKVNSGESPLFMVEPVRLKPKCVGLVQPSKIKKSNFFSQVLCFFWKTIVYH